MCTPPAYQVKSDAPLSKRGVRRLVLLVVAFMVAAAFVFAKTWVKHPSQVDAAGALFFQITGVVLLVFYCAVATQLMVKFITTSCEECDNDSNCRGTRNYGLTQAQA